MGITRPAVVIQQEGDGHVVADVVVGGEVEGVLPGDLPQAGVCQADLISVVVPGVWLAGSLLATALTGGATGEGDQ